MYNILVVDDDKEIVSAIDLEEIMTLPEEEILIEVDQGFPLLQV